MKYGLIALLLLSATAANAASHALMLSDDEVTALRAVLDAATKAQGLAIAPTTVYFANKLNAAPTVQPQTPATPAPAPAQEGAANAQ